MAKSENHIQPETRTVASIPEPVRAIPLPPPPEARDNEVRYSVVVADQPVREVLMAMARETKINFDIDPRVEGTVNLNAIDQTLKQILNRMAKQVDMRWEVDGQTITVMRDTPYLHNYRVDYVNMSRDTSEVVGIATQVISGSLAGTAAGATPTLGGANNSTLTITSTSRNRFWDTLERNIRDLLRETDKLLPEGSSETFVQSRGQSASTTSQARTTTARRPAAAPPAGAAPRSTTEGPGESQQASDSERVEQRLTFREAASVIVNAETGIISVRATSRQHEKVREFLEQITGASRRQVVIEATVVEVTLNDNYQAGVDWASLGLNGLGYSIQQSFGNPSLPSPQGTAALGSTLFSIHYSNPNAAIGGNISSTIKLLEQFGRTRVLSSPKLMVLNNQTAMLKVVDNRVYFTVQSSTQQNQTQTLKTVTTTQNVVPVGFIMNVTPQISDADMVTLNVRPTVTRIIDQVQDPNPDIPANTPSFIPVTQTREMESMLKVASGQTAILGGLMIDSFEAKRNGLPIASRIPLFGDLVSAKNELSLKSELVIFIRPLVVRDPSIEGDLAAYRRYMPSDQFFRDTQPPFPKVEERVRRLENARSPFPDVEVKTVPVVPDAPPPVPR
ncbi:MAG TPA: type II and III secretion system protein [Usitatibacter sp.]|nr:type II and III secretion system protein [Usitatibacter sp.]